MPVRAINNHYEFEPRDLQHHYGDNILIYVGWDHHTLYCSAHAMLVSPQQTFQEFLDQQRLCCTNLSLKAYSAI